MAYKTLLQAVNQAENELGIAASGTVFGNTDEQAVQMLGLANGIGNDLVQEHQWQALQTSYIFSTASLSYTGDTTAASTTLSALSDTTTIVDNPTYYTVLGTGLLTDSALVSVNAGASTAVISRPASAAGTTTALTFSQIKYALPTDFDRLIDRTDWDKTQHWALLGPESPQQWQWLISSNLSSGPRSRFRVQGDLFVVWPPPTTVRQLRYEYVSNFWIATASGTAPTLSAYAADTNTAVFHDRLFIGALKLRYAQANGLDWMLPQLAMAPRGVDPAGVQFPMRMLDDMKTADAGSSTLSMAPVWRSPILGWRNLPDAGYGS